MIRTTLGEVLRSVVPKRKVCLNDTASGTASTEAIFTSEPRGPWSSAHAQLGVRLAGLDPGVAEVGQVDRLIGTGEEVLGQRPTDAQGVHEAVAGEAGGDVQVVVATGPAADDRVAVQPVLVVEAGPGAFLDEVGEPAQPMGG